MSSLGPTVTTVPGVHSYSLPSAAVIKLLSAAEIMVITQKLIGPDFDSTSMRACKSDLEECVMHATTKTP